MSKRLQVRIKKIQKLSKEVSVAAKKFYSLREKLEKLIEQRIK